MEFITYIFSTETLFALGWTMLHSLWQGAAVALLLSAFLLTSQKRNARLRYLAGNVALAIVFLLAVGTFIYFLEQGKSSVALAAETVLPFETWEQATVYLAGDQGNSFVAYFENHLTLLVSVWFLGMLFFPASDGRWAVVHRTAEAPPLV